MTSLNLIGRNIAKLRNQRNQSQEDLAGAAEINRGYLSRIENGHVDFSVSVLLKIAKALDAPPQDILQ